MKIRTDGFSGKAIVLLGALAVLTGCGGGGSSSESSPSDFDAPVEPVNIGGDGDIFDPERLLDVETLARAEAEKMRESLAALQSPPGPIAPTTGISRPQRITPPPPKPSPARARTTSDSFWTLDLVKGVVQQGATEAAEAGTFLER